MKHNLHMIITKWKAKIYKKYKNKKYKMNIPIIQRKYFRKKMYSLNKVYALLYKIKSNMLEHKNELSKLF